MDTYDTLSRRLKDLKVEYKKAAADLHKAQTKQKCLKIMLDEARQTLSAIKGAIESCQSYDIIHDNIRDILNRT